MLQKTPRLSPNKANEPIEIMHSDKKQQNIIVRITKNFKDINIDLERIENLVKSICLRFGRSKKPPDKYEISIVIADNKSISKLNRQFLGRSSPTDCLSFNLSDEPESPAPKSPNLKLFELVVNAERALRQAALRHLESQAELALYITHSLLHQFGFDDSTKAQAKKMHDTEDEILQQHGFGLVYNKDKRT